MTKLQKWMTENGWRDPHVAERIGVSRAQISRIRRGKTGVSIATAKALAKLTGYRWHVFLQAVPVRSAKRKKAV